jgi:hypothetical protein
MMKGHRVIMVKTMGWLGEGKVLRIPDAGIGRSQIMVAGFAA